MSRIRQFADGFRQGSSLVKDVYRDYKLAEIEKAKPEGLDAVAPARDFDDPNDETPRVEPPAPQPQTKFLGQTYEGTLDQDGVEAARAGARASVYRKIGDLRSAREEERYGLDMADRKENAKLRGMQLEKAGLELEGIKGQAKLRQALEEVNGGVAERFKKRLLDADGNPRAPTVDDEIEFYRDLSGSYLERGLVEQSAGARQNLGSLIKARMDQNKAERVEIADDAARRLAAGDTSGVLKLYSMVPDGGVGREVKPDGKGGFIVTRNVGGRVVQDRLSNDDMMGFIGAMRSDNAAEFTMGLAERNLRMRGEQARIRAAEASTAASRTAAGERAASAKQERVAAQALQKLRSPDGSIDRSKYAGLSDAEKLALEATGKVPQAGEGKFQTIPAGLTGGGALVNLATGETISIGQNGGVVRGRVNAAPGLGDAEPAPRGASAAQAESSMRAVRGPDGRLVLAGPAQAAPPAAGRAPAGQSSSPAAAAAAQAISSGSAAMARAAQQAPGFAELPDQVKADIFKVANGR